MMCLAALIYVVSPIDAIPDVIPFIGLSDDFVVLTALFAALSGMALDLGKYEQDDNERRPPGVADDAAAAAQVDVWAAFMEAEEAEEAAAAAAAAAEEERKEEQQQPLRAKERQGPQQPGGGEGSGMEMLLRSSSGIRNSAGGSDSGDSDSDLDLASYEDAVDQEWVLAP